MKALITKKFLISLTLFTLVASAFLGMAYSAGIGRVIQGILRADAVWLLFIIAMQSLAYWAYVIPYKYINKLSFKAAAHHSFEGFMPFKAKGGLNYDLSTSRLNRSSKLVSYLGLWEYIVLAPAIMVAAVFAYIYRTVPISLSLPWMFGVPIGVIIAGLMFVYRDSSNLKRFKPIVKFNNLIKGIFKAQNKRDSLLLIAGMCLYWFGEVMALWGALQLFDINLNWFALLIAYATGYIFTRRSLPLGGAGLILVTLALALHWVGASLPLAVLAALAYQVINLLVPMFYRRKALV